MKSFHFASFLRHSTLCCLMAGFLLWLITTGVAQAQKPPDTSEGEVAMLPKYCIDTMGFGYGDAYYGTSPRAGYWVGLMGKSFWAMHHHCFGLIKLRRATSGLYPALARVAYLGSAVNEFEYVLRASQPDFIMLPEVNLQLGNTQVLLKNYAAAQIAYERAVKQKPDFAPPYARWAEVLEKLGNKKTALAFLERGLRHAPTSAELLAQYKRLGGNAEAFVKSLPPPPVAAPAVAEADSPKVPPTPASGAAAPVPPAVDAPQALSADVAASATSR